MRLLTGCGELNTGTIRALALCVLVLPHVRGRGSIRTR